MKHISTENSSDLAEPQGEALALPFEEGAGLVGSEAPPPELAGNPRYRVLPEFDSQALGNSRCIRVYLPEAYITEPHRRFPVFYLHDGQNLIDARTSYVVDHTWRAHITADELTHRGEIEPIILVGIDNTGIGRMGEYTPTRDIRMGGGDGDQYGELIVEELMPLMNRELRTLTGPEHTGLGGSSLGGLISLYLGLERSEVFGKLAVLSPSVWWNQRAILSFIRTVKPKPRVWLDMGTAEGLRHLRDCDLLHHRLVQRGWKDRVDLRYLRVGGGLHNEDAWAARFSQVLRFLFPAERR